VANDAPPRLIVDDNANFLEAARFLLDQEGWRSWASRRAAPRR
jgi:FixJ family two-component response regulator